MPELIAVRDAEAEPNHIEVGKERKLREGERADDPHARRPKRRRALHPVVMRTSRRETNQDVTDARHEDSTQPVLRYSHPFSERARSGR